MRLKTTEVAACRANILARQGYRCALCQLPCTMEQAVQDHDHSTGAIRGVLHRSCNALLGKIENNYRRYGLQNLAAFCNGLAAYFQKHESNVTGLFHPSHRTPEEKRVRTNAKARAKRAASKSSV